MRGKWVEAENLLKAFRKDVKKSGRQAFNHEVAIERRIRRSKGICINIGCARLPVKGKSYCEQCNVVRNNWARGNARKLRESNKKRYQELQNKKKEGKTCDVCGGPIPLDKSLSAKYCCAKCKNKNRNRKRRKDMLI